MAEVRPSQELWKAQDGMCSGSDAATSIYALRGNCHFYLPDKMTNMRRQALISGIGNARYRVHFYKPWTDQVFCILCSHFSPVFLHILNPSNVRCRNYCKQAQNPYREGSEYGKPTGPNISLCGLCALIHLPPACLLHAQHRQGKLSPGFCFLFSFC